MAAAGAWRTSPRLAGALIALTVGTALLPTAIALASGALVGALPGAGTGGAAAGSGAAGWRAGAALAALGLLLVAQQVAGPLRGVVVGEALGRRYMGGVHRRVMAAALRPATIRHLEDPRLHDDVQRSLGGGNLGARVTGVAGVPPGLADVAAERLRGAAALAVVAHFSPWLALLLAAVWLHHLRRMQAAHGDLIDAKLLRTPGLRHAQYVGGLSLAPEAAKEVRIFGLGGWLGTRYERAWLAEMAGPWARRAGLAGAYAAATLPALAASGLALALLGRAAALGEIGLGALLVYANGVLQSQALGSVSDRAQTVQYGTAGLRPLAALERTVATSPELVLPGRRPVGGRPREAIRFEGVAFAYPGREAPVLRDLTLEIPAGRSLALVGANGAGKTTVLKLLARLYDPTAGRITADGVDLRELEPHLWQRRVGGGAPAPAGARRDAPAAPPGGADGGDPHRRALRAPGVPAPPGPAQARRRGPGRPVPGAAAARRADRAPGPLRGPAGRAAPGPGPAAPLRTPLAAGQRAGAAPAAAPGGGGGGAPAPGVPPAIAGLG
jgi:ATP-binding cassette subfamily B protein